MTLRSVPAPAVLPGATLRPRSEWVDVARGLTILLVVLFHSFRGLSSAGLVPADSLVPAADFAVYTFHMPAFFFISGLFLRRALAQPPGVFWFGRMRALLLPYFIWMTVEIVVLHLTSSMSNTGDRIGFSTAVYLLDPLAPFWFLYSLFVISAVIYVARRLPDATLLGVALLLAVLSWSDWRSEPVLVLRTVNGLLFVCLGMAFRPWIGRQVPPAFALPLAAVLFAGVVVLSYPLFLDTTYRPEAALPAAFLGVAGIVLLSQALAAWRLSHLLAPVRFLGQISLSILVVHILGTAGMRILLLRVFHVHDFGLHLVMGTAAGLGLGVGLQWAATRLALITWLGLPDVPVRLRRNEALVPGRCG